MISESRDSVAAPVIRTFTPVRFVKRMTDVRELTRRDGCREEKRTFSIDGGYLVVETASPADKGATPNVSKVGYQRYERGHGLLGRGSPPVARRAKVVAPLIICNSATPAAVLQ